jgi:hypothetical protein
MIKKPPKSEVRPVDSCHPSRVVYIHLTVIAVEDRVIKVKE